MRDPPLVFPRVVQRREDEAVDRVWRNPAAATPSRQRGHGMLVGSPP